MAILCRKQVLFLAFPSRESLKQWETTIQTELGEGMCFPCFVIQHCFNVKYIVHGAILRNSGLSEDQLCFAKMLSPRRPQLFTAMLDADTDDLDRND